MDELPRTQSLRCFITVAREGTVSRAAQLLDLTQPAVSLQLKGLEESTGLLLFNRTPGGFTLTEAGASLLPLAHKAVSAASDFRTMAGSLNDIQRGTLRVGTILDPEFIRLGPFVRGLAGAMPKTELLLRHGDNDGVLGQIGRSELDVGFRIDIGAADQQPGAGFSPRGIEDGKFQFLPLASHDYRVIVPPGWADRIAAKPWADLARLPWITTPPGSVHQWLLDDVFRPLRTAQRRVADADREDAMIDFVESGVGLGLVSDAALAQRAVHKRNFIIVDRLSLSCELGFVCLTVRRHEPAIAQAFTALQAVWDFEPTGIAPAAVAAVQLPARPRKPVET